MIAKRRTRVRVRVFCMCGRFEDEMRVRLDAEVKSMNAAEQEKGGEETECRLSLSPLWSCE